jgi:hypothetical protein
VATISREKVLSEIANEEIRGEIEIQTKANQGYGQIAF